MIGITKRIEFAPYTIIVADDPRGFQRDEERINLYIYERIEGRRHVWYYDADEDRYYSEPLKEAPEQAEAPTLSLPRSLVAAIVAGLTDYRAPDSATQHHLEDTIEVRNRLLSIVETMNPRQVMLPTQYAGPPE